MQKALDDVKAVMRLGKPEAVINKFVASFLEGEALAPILAAEAEYLNLVNQADEPDLVDQASGEVLYSPNAARDARIAELEAAFPHLVNVGDGSSVQERRPEISISAGEVDAFRRDHYQELRRGAYPPIGDQLDAILKQLNQMRLDGAALVQDADVMVNAWLAVKARFPKPGL